MLLRLIKNNRTPGIILIASIMIALWTKSIVFPIVPESFSQMPVYDFIFGGLNHHPVLSSILGAICYAIIMVLIVRFNEIHFLLEDRSYMPVVFFLLLLGSYPHSLQLNPVLLASIFLILAILMLIRGDEHRADPMALFNASLLVAAGSIFYLKLIWFIPFLWITAAIIRPLKWRGILNPILVLLMLMLFYVTYYWVFKNDLGQLKDVISENLFISNGNFRELSLPLWIISGYLLLLVLLSSGYMLSRFQARKIIIRKLYQVFFILFVYCVFFYFFVSGYHPEMITLLIIPVAYLFSNYFQRKKNPFIHQLMIWLWILLVFYIQISEIYAR